MLEAREMRLQPKKEERSAPHVPRGRSYPLTKSPSRARGLLLIMVLACFLMALASIFQYSRMVGISREIYRAESRIEQLKQENKSLEKEVASLTSVERIERIAREEIGMQTPDHTQIYLLSRETGGEASARSLGED